MTTTAPVVGRIARSSDHSPDPAVARAEFAAQLNAETLESARAKHRVEVSDLHRKLQAATRRLNENDDTLLNSVVVLADGSMVTLHSLFEDAHTEEFQKTRRLCATCRKPECFGVEDHQ